MRSPVNLSHLVTSLTLQGLFFLVHGDLWLGAVAALFFYLGREIAQAEYRGIEGSPTKLRKDFPLLGGLYPKYWTRKAFLADLVIPSSLTILIAIIYSYF
jgi:hypothetical protein